MTFNANMTMVNLSILAAALGPLVHPSHSARPQLQLATLTTLPLVCCRVGNCHLGSRHWEKFELE